MKSKYIIISISAIIIVIAGILYFSLSLDNVNARIDINNTNGRPIYNGIESSVFNDLPDYPSNFVIIRRDVYSNQIIELNRISESIYKQPEFYPTWNTNGLMWFTHHDYSRWGVHGYGFFPGELNYNIHNMSKDDIINVYSFLHTSWGIETWQGIKLIPDILMKADTRYFDVTLTPNEVLLEPTFPKFYNNWSQIVNMQIVAKEQVPEGQYKFIIRFESPSNDNNNKWTWNVIDKYTDNKFHHEIQKCINNIQTERCNELIELRQNKYVHGTAFTPSNQYTVTINII